MTWWLGLSFGRIELVCLSLLINEQSKELAYPKSPGTPGPPNHINYYILKFGYLDYHLGEFDLFVWHWKCKQHYLPQKSREPGSPQTILTIMFWDQEAWIIIWEEWICLFTIGNAKTIVYPKIPGIPNHPNHINYHTSGIGCQHYHLGELTLVVYQWKYKGNCISQNSRDFTPTKPY